MQPRILLIAALAALGAGLFYVSTAPSARTDPPVPKHIVLISIDTLRADHLGAYGHPRAVTPNLDALARDAVVFEHHISSAPTTLASHTAMFTGNHPHTHGAPRNDYVVSDDNVFLQEMLSDSDFETAAFLGAIPIASHSNFTQGFDHVDEQFSLHRTVDGVAQTMRDGNEVTDAALRWVGERSDDSPLFLFAHYFDVHSPYLPPEEHLAHYHPDPSIEGAGTMRHIARTRSLLAKGAPQAKRHSDTLKERYLGGVTHADAEVGRLLDGLADMGLLDEALVIITSDHGETFDTHEELWNHGQTVFDETVRTPLILRFPGKWSAGLRLGDVVSNIDLVPTLVALLDLDAPSVEGTSLLPMLRGDPFRAAHPPAFAEGTKPHTGKQAGWQNAPMQKAIRTDSRKLVLDPRKDEMRLYDLTDDPDELLNVAAEHPGDVRQLRDQLDAWRWSASPLPSQRQSSGRVKAELAALGYVDDDEPAEGEDEPNP